MDNVISFQEDLEYLEKRLHMFRKKEQAMFDALDSLLDVFTMLPMCINEYGENTVFFGKFKEVKSALRKVAYLFDAYDISLPPLQSSETE